MLKTVKQYSNKQHLSNLGDFSIRIGIHSGNAVAGVTGTKMINYDIWGETPMLSSHLSRIAPLNSILVSEETYWYLSTKNYLFEPAEMVHFKVTNDKEIE